MEVSSDWLKFEPIVITIESQDEFDAIMDALDKSDGLLESPLHEEIITDLYSKMEQNE